MATQITAIIRTNADIPNKAFDNSGNDVLVADAISERAKSNIIAIFLIKPIFAIIFYTAIIFFLHKSQQSIYTIESSTSDTIMRNSKKDWQNFPADMQMDSIAVMGY